MDGPGYEPNKTMPFPLRDFLRLRNQIKTHLKCKMFNETEKDLNLSLRKISFGIENTITSEGHRLKLYANSFGVVV
jgi:hypothetical protein